MRDTRFYDDARTRQEALAYYRQRAIQFLPDGWKWDGTYADHEWGIEVVFKRDHDTTRYVSAYVLSDHVGAGHLSNWFYRHRAALASGETVFITSDPCGKMKSWLEYKGLPFRLVSPDYWEWPEYHAISERYGDRRAKRSRQFLIQHIEEGIYLLRRLNATEGAQRAFCLHPLVQEDAALTAFERERLVRIHGFSPWTLALAMEYRHIANGHLRGHRIGDPSEIRLSPLSEVNDMLRADKIQNRKDFRRYHLETHPRAAELDAYYCEWLVRLGVTQKQYAALAYDIEARTAERGLYHVLPPQ